jgi:hypothetical protein
LTAIITERRETVIEKHKILSNMVVYFVEMLFSILRKDFDLSYKCVSIIYGDMVSVLATQNASL